MRVLMLGWEFPPTINGGLGTACGGLVHAMDGRGIEVRFVVPAAPPPAPPRVESLPAVPVASADASRVRRDRQSGFTRRAYTHVEFHTIAVRLSPYASGGRSVDRLRSAADEWIDDGSPEAPDADAPASGDAATGPSLPPAAPVSPSESGLFADVKRYTEQAEAFARTQAFDVVHAHDWMTFPAGLSVAARTGMPLVAHVHSTEADRGGPDGDARIADVERRGVHGAVRVIAVSAFTRRQLVQRYGVAEDKIDVVYNAVEPPPDFRLAASDFSIKHGEKIVLFMGRLTGQKGPQYFLTAARKVLEVMDDVRFVMAGDGDLARQTVELAAAFGIAHKVLFTGFLRGLDVERIFQLADLFVMPSVSEPFGIAPVEAVVRQVPTIISKQSGVGEVLRHALKVDFWDTNELANKIVAVLRHPTLARMMRADADRDVARLTWDAAAADCVRTYERAIAVMP